MSSAEYEVAHKNILAILEHGNATREIVRELEAKLNSVDMLSKRVEALEEQVRILQVKLYSGGPT